MSDSHADPTTQILQLLAQGLKSSANAKERTLLYLTSAKSLAAHGAVDRAIEVATKALDEFPSCLELHHVRVSLLIKAQLYNQLETAVVRMLAVPSSKSSETTLKIASLSYIKLNNVEMARKYLVKLVHQQPTTENKLQLSAFLAEHCPPSSCLKIGRLCPSNNILHQRATCQSTNPHLIAENHLLLAMKNRIYGRIDDYESPTTTLPQSIKHMNKACHISPNNPAFWVELAAHKYAEASFLQVPNLWVGVLRTCQIALRHCTHSSSNQVILALKLMICEALFHNGHPEEAVRDAEKLSDKHSDDSVSLSRCLHAMARIHLQRKDLHKGLECYRKAVAANPKNFILWEEMAKTYESQGKFEAAEICLKQCASSESKAQRIRAMVRLGNLYFLMKKSKAGLETLGEVLKMDGTHAVANFLTGVFYLNARQFKDAMDFFNRAGESDPMLPWGPLAVSEVDKSQKQYDYAAEGVQALLDYRIPETYPMCFVQLGLISEANGNRIVSRQMLAKALHMLPNSESIRSQLKEWSRPTTS